MLALMLVACRPSPTPVRSLDPNADVVVPYAVAGGGEIRFTVHPRYVTGQAITLALDLSAGTLAVRGPTSGRVAASASAGERVVRMLGSSDLVAAQVEPGEKTHLVVTWDGRDGGGAFVPAETYSLSLDFVVGGESLRLGSVIEVRAP